MSDFEKIVGYKVRGIFSLEELRVLVYYLSPEDSFIHKRAKLFLPSNHEEIRDSVVESLRRFHDRNSHLLEPRED